MKRLFQGLVILLLVFSIACIRVVPGGSSLSNQGSSTPSNQQPLAYIDAISPATTSAGELVSFRGHGTDADGLVIAYEWRSSLDGVLSTAPSFTSSSLSAGVHTIFLKVLDNTNLWSAEASGIITVTPKITKPVINAFTASPKTIVAGNIAELSWNVSGARTIFIDNGIGTVNASGSKILYPSSTTVYTLTATNEAGNVTAVASVEVLASSTIGNPIIHYFTAQHLGGTSWRLQWSVSNATSVVIEPYIGSVGLLGSVVVNTPVTQTYQLTAKNGWNSIYHRVIVMYQ